MSEEIEMSKEQKVAGEAANAPEVLRAQDRVEKPQSAEDIKKAFEGFFATGYTPVYVNSLKKEVGFKEITVQQQKTLSRVMIGNEQRKDIIYDAQCALINEACATEGFDIYKLLELDRLKLLIALYQANMFNNDVKFTCKECGSENQYKLDFNNVLVRLDAIDVEPKKFRYANNKFVFEFEIAYPSVKLVSNFHKQYCLKHRVTSKKDIQVNDTMSNMEYVNLFIKAVKISDLNGNELKSVDFTGFKAADIESILQMFPQDVLYTENGVLNFITKEFLQKLNDSFDKHQCARCGAIQEDERSSQAESFL